MPVIGFLLAGNYNNGSFNNGGSNGNYWSSTANSSTNAYNLNFNSGNVNSANNSNRRNGNTVRCVYGSEVRWPRLLFMSGSGPLSPHLREQCSQKSSA